MERKLKCSLLLSLEEMALRRIAVLLWDDAKILASLKSFGPGWNKTKWLKTLEPQIEEKVSKLQLTQSLTKRIVELSKPIGLHIKRYQEWHRVSFFSVEFKGLPASPKLCWTTAGTIDTLRTVQEILQCDAETVERCYILACNYCLEDCIPVLWEKLPEDRKSFYSGSQKHFTLPFCWPHILTGEHSKLEYLLKTDGPILNLNQCAFEHSARLGNKTATQYFFQKLTRVERKVSLIRAARQAVMYRNRMYDYMAATRSDVVCYLLSVMTAEQQMEILEEHSVNILLCFLNWPWQDLFSENASLLWACLPQNEYNVLLERMTANLQAGDYCFLKSLEEFFTHSPPDLKKRFVVSRNNEFPASDFLSVCFEAEDPSYVKVMFRNVSAADRLKVVFHPKVFELFFQAILLERWTVVEACLREATLSQDDNERLRDAFTAYIDRSISGQCVNRKFKRFFDFLDKTLAIASSENTESKHKPENCCTEQ